PTLQSRTVPLARPGPNPWDAVPTQRPGRPPGSAVACTNATAGRSGKAVKGHAPMSRAPRDPLLSVEGRGRAPGALSASGCEDLLLSKGIRQRISEIKASVKWIRQRVAEAGGNRTLKSAATPC